MYFYIFFFFSFSDEEFFITIKRKNSNQYLKLSFNNLPVNFFIDLKFFNKKNENLNLNQYFYIIFLPYLKYSFIQISYKNNKINEKILNIFFLILFFFFQEEEILIKVLNIKEINELKNMFYYCSLNEVEKYIIYIEKYLKQILKNLEIFYELKDYSFLLKKDFRLLIINMLIQMKKIKNKNIIFNFFKKYKNIDLYKKEFISKQKISQKVFLEKLFSFNENQYDIYIIINEIFFYFCDFNKKNNDIIIIYICILILINLEKKNFFMFFLKNKEKNLYLSIDFEKNFLLQKIKIINFLKSFMEEFFNIKYKNISFFKKIVICYCNVFNFYFFLFKKNQNFEEI